MAPFIVSDDVCTHEMILGMDLMTAHNAVIDVDNNSVKLDHIHLIELNVCSVNNSPITDLEKRLNAALAMIETLKLEKEKKKGFTSTDDLD